MNLLDRLISIKNILKPGFILLIPVFFSCETSDDIGVEYNLETGAQVRFIEFTLPATNVYIDSLRTDDEFEILVGTYNDAIAGEISAEGYFQFSYSSGPLPRSFISDSNPFPLDTIQMDSVVIQFEANGTTPRSGSSVQDFSIYELQDSLINTAIYLSNLESTKGVAIGTFSQSIDLETDTLFRIKLSDDFSNRLFTELGEIAQDPDRFPAVERFQSLGLVANAGSESITSFQLNADTSRLLIYSSPIDPDAKDTTYVTSFIFSSKSYTYLDRSAATYTGVGNLNRFDLPSNQTLIDPIYGISTIYSVQELENFFDENRNTILNSAYLTFEIQDESERDTLERSYGFFVRENGYFGPAVEVDPFQNLIMSDNAFLRGDQDFPAISVFSENKDELVLNSTLFFQTLFTFYKEYNSLVFENASGDPFSLSEFMPISTNDVTLQRTIIRENGVKLRLFYTEVD